MERTQFGNNLGNIRTLAEQMVQKSFGNDYNQFPGEQNNYLQNSDFNNKYNIPKPERRKTKNNKNDFYNNQSPKNDLIYSKNIIQDDSSKLINTNVNSNINTNLNTASHLNSYNNINNTNQKNNNFNEMVIEKNSSMNIPMNENENTSNLSMNKDLSKRLENISITDLSESKEMKESSNDIVVEIVDPKLFINNYVDSSDYSQKNNSKFNVNKNLKKSKLKKMSLYEREIRNRKRAKEIRDKKSKKIENEELKELQPKPVLNKNSIEIIKKKNSYIPINERAAIIQNMKISQRILKEASYKIMQQRKDWFLSGRNKIKAFDQDEWEEFVEKQYQWKDEIECKKKVAKLCQNEVNEKNLFKPKINNRSRSIISDRSLQNNDFIDEVYIRLYNDFEEHKERQKLRNQESLPTFKPKILKNCSTKNMFGNIKTPFRCGTNPHINFLNNINNNNNISSKKKYRLHTSNSIDKNNEVAKSAKSEILFCDIYNNNIEKYLNTDQNTNKKIFVNKTQGPTQPTNNTRTHTHTNANNYTDINTDVINSKCIIYGNPITPINNRNNLNINKAKPKKPYLPQKIKQMIDKNCSDVQEEEKNDEENNNLTSNKNSNFNFENKTSSNYNLHAISNINESNYDESNNNNNTKNKYKESIENNEDDNFDDDIDKSIEELMNKKFHINKNQNQNNENLENLEQNEIQSHNEQNEIVLSEESNNGNNKLYKLNIRENTPHLIREDVIMASKDCSNFFDIPNMDDE